MRSCLALSGLFLAAPCFAQIGAFATSTTFTTGQSQTNNPYSLVLEHKQVQTLADGTHISTTTHEYLYRDSLGRARTENEFPIPRSRGDEIRSISVMDPVAGTMMNWQTGQPGNAQREYTRFERIAPRQDERIQASSGPRTEINATHVIVELDRNQVQQPRFKTERLGTQDVSGASCEATRTTTTYPIGFFGNDRPITSTHETCMSQEFGRALQETQEDPRSGTRTTTVQSLSRGEPDPSLFRPPAGYTERVAQPAGSR